MNTNMHFGVETQSTCQSKCKFQIIKHMQEFLESFHTLTHKLTSGRT